jgi:lipoprotein-releasing system ATP-binding protein
MTAPALHLDKVGRCYKQADVPLEVLRAVDFSLWAGQSVALVAPSGAGKSTLLHIAGLLEKPDTGEVFVGERPTAHMADHERTALRRDSIGFVYQFHHLLPEFTAIENVLLPQMIHGLQRKEARQRGQELLDYLGLGKRLNHLPSELSGGEALNGLVKATGLAALIATHNMDLAQRMNRRVTLCDGIVVELD